MLVHDFLDASAALTPDALALCAGSQQLTFASLAERCNRLANGLLDAGLPRGARVVVFLENGVEAAVSIWATSKADGVFVVVNPSTKLDKLAYVIADCSAWVLITDAAKLARVDISGMPSLQQIIVVGAPPREPGRVVDFEAVLSSASPRARAPRAIDIDLAALVYTSGSTGKPKGVMSTHANIEAASRSIIAYLKLCRDDVVLSVLPLAFGYGLYQLLMTARAGGTLLLERGFAYPGSVLQALERHGVTIFPLMPTMLAVALQLELGRFPAPQLRAVTSAGQALPRAYSERLRAVWPKVALYSMYGLTECTRVSYLPPEELLDRPDSIGRGMPNEEVYLVDDHGHRLPLGNVGELVVRGANVTKGYWGLPEETAKVFRPGRLPDERVLHTGDIFHQDEQGWLYFVGRKDDIIKSRGQKVSPREVEDVLHSMPGVMEAAVVGVEDEVLGQAVKAIVVPQPGSELTAADVRRHCAARLEDFMVPRHVELRPTLPKGATGKVDKRAL